MTRSSAQSGVALPILLIIVMVLVGGGYYLYSSGLIKLPQTPLTSNETNIELKSEYQNPFDASSQYVNPFSNYKNPFDSIK